MTAVIVYEESICNVKWGTYVLIGLLALIFGILIFMFPELTAGILVVLFGVMILVLAILTLISALMSTSEHGRPLWLLLLAILGFIVGAIAIIAPQIFGAFLAIIIGIVLFVIGLMNITIALSEKNYPHRWLLFLMGLLSIIFAILFIIEPLTGAVILFGYLIGVYFFLYGILSIIAGLALRSVKNEYCKA